jgi:hypothetical protein
MAAKTIKTTRLAREMDRAGLSPSQVAAWADTSDTTVRTARRGGKVSHSSATRLARAMTDLTGREFPVSALRGGASR